MYENIKEEKKVRAILVGLDQGGNDLDFER